MLPYWRGAFPSSRSCPSGQKGPPRPELPTADWMMIPRSTRSRLDVTPTRSAGGSAATVSPNPARVNAAGLCQGGLDADPNSNT
jgi:hypothetical protein